MSRIGLFFDRPAGILHRLFLGGSTDGGLAILLYLITGVPADPLCPALGHALCRTGATGEETGERDKQNYLLHGNTHR